jgi:hypothetical protein
MSQIKFRVVAQGTRHVKQPDATTQEEHPNCWHSGKVYPRFCQKQASQPFIAAILAERYIFLAARPDGQATAREQG